VAGTAPTAAEPLNPSPSSSVPGTNRPCHWEPHLNDEADFLGAILAHPEDDAPRLVYADWLEERGDPDAIAMAAYLRDTARMIPAGARKLGNVQNRLLTAARSLDSEWLAIVSKLTIEVCRYALEGHCPMQWERLTATDEARVRSC